MRRCPRILHALFWAFIAIAVSFPIQVAVVYGQSWTEIPSILDKLTWLNWMVMGGLLVSAILVRRASPFSKVAIPGLILLVAFNNAVVGFYNTDFSMMGTCVATFAFALLNVPLLHPEIRHLLRKPERRWWLEAPRKRVTLPIAVNWREIKLQSETFDLSETGAFISLQGQEERSEFQASQALAICMTFGTFQQFRCHGRVVRRTTAKGEYPAGIGIEFTGLDRQQRQQLKRFMAQGPR